MKEQRESDFSLAEIQTNARQLSYYVDLIGSQIEEKGPDALPRAQVSIFLAFWAQGIVSHGGLRYFYELSNEPLASARAFHYLGLPEAAKAIEESTLVWPAEVLEASREERIAWMDLHRKALEELWDGAERVIMALSRHSPEGSGDVLEVRTREFINEHLSDFEFT